MPPPLRRDQSSPNLPPNTTYRRLWHGSVVRPCRTHALHLVLAALPRPKSQVVLCSAPCVVQTSVVLLICPPCSTSRKTLLLPFAANGLRPISMLCHMCSQMSPFRGAAHRLYMMMSTSVVLTSVVLWQIPLPEFPRVRLQLAVVSLVLKRGLA